MTERGVALLAVLWVLLVVSTVGLAAGAGARVGLRATENRVVLAKARWAAEACLAIVQERRHQDSVDLGHGMSCRVSWEDAGARGDLTRADSALFTRLLRALDVRTPRGDTVAGLLLAARRQARLRAPEHLASLAGITADEAVQLEALLTVDGPGSINVNAAPHPVLLALPGLGEHAAREIIRRREFGRPINELADIVAALHPAARDSLLGAYATLVALTTTRTVAYRVEATGGVRGFAPTLTIEAVLVPTNDRLALVRRRMR